MLYIIFLLLICSKQVHPQTKTVEYYENIINSAIQNASTYEFDKDANRYKPDDDRIEDCGSYDFIIIGGGSAGNIIANRLSEIKIWTVLLIEAGHYPNDATSIPDLSTVMMFSDYNWGQVTEPQKNGCVGLKEKRCPYPQGRGLGGTSLINSILYGRANPKYFDDLEKAGNPGWNYSTVLPYFLKSENFTQTNPAATINNNYHAKKGPQHVENFLIDNSRTTAFLDANKELFRLTDYNSPQQIGASLVQATKRNGKRADTGTEFILPILSRKNLKVVTEAFVTKIVVELLQNIKKAKEVLYTRNNKTCKVRALKEVILSAGSIGSPKILMQSGIGKNLSQFGINEIQNLNVGTQLYDHFTVTLTFTYNSTDQEKTLKEYIQDFLDNKGVLTSSGPADGNGYYLTQHAESEKYPDYLLIVEPFIPNPIPNLQEKFFNYKKSISDDLAKIYSDKTFLIFIIAINTKSVGTVKLKSNSPYDYVNINSNILQDSRDRDILFEGIQQMKKFASTDAFKRINAQLLYPALTACQIYEEDSTEYWYCIIKHLSVPDWVPVGTCPMGPSATNSVVDSQLKVHGFKNLRVADCSIFPKPLPSYGVANCMLVGEMASDMIKKEYYKIIHSIISPVGTTKKLEILNQNIRKIDSYSVAFERDGCSLLGTFQCSEFAIFYDVPCVFLFCHLL